MNLFLVHCAQNHFGLSQNLIIHLGVPYIGEFTLERNHAAVSIAQSFFCVLESGTSYDSSHCLRRTIQLLPAQIVFNFSSIIRKHMKALTGGINCPGGNLGSVSLTSNIQESGTGISSDLDTGGQKTYKSGSTTLSKESTVYQAALN